MAIGVPFSIIVIDSDGSPSPVMITVSSCVSKPVAGEVIEGAIKSPQMFVCISLVAPAIAGEITPITASTNIAL